MNEQKNVETIQQIYGAFGRGEIDYILAQLTDDVSWFTHFPKHVPWAGDFSGKSNVPKFFDAIFNSVDVIGFEPTEFVTQGDTVVSMGTFAATAKSTGKSAHTPWVFVWKLKNGKVASYEQFHSPDLADIFLA